LNKDDNSNARKNEIDKTVIFIRQTKNGPVPENIKKEKNHSQGIVYPAAIITFHLHFLITNFAIVN
jgi:hypothetical protein